MTSPKPSLFFFTTTNQRHGGFASACGLVPRLRRYFHVTACSLRWPFAPPAPDNWMELSSLADDAVDFGSFPTLSGGDHALFYMNDYPSVFKNHTGRWQESLAGAASVQFVLNRGLGGLPGESWLAHRVNRLYFHDSWMEYSWRTLTSDSALSEIPSDVLFPPVDLAPFRELPGERPTAPPLVVGRLAGDGDVPRDAAEFYRRLAGELDEARFWFMPAPDELQSELGDDPRFRFLERDAMPVADFLRACHVYALTYRPGVPVPGPRSLMEAMAAGCAPVVVDRDGPRDRVVHGESGFRANDDDEFIRYVVALGRDEPLRHRIGHAARERSRAWHPDIWVERIVRHSVGQRAAPAPG